MPNLIGDVWIGSCPECEHSPEMFSNEQGAFECPVCHVQVVAWRGVSVLPDKGNGEFIVLDGKRVSAVEELRLDHDLVIRTDFREP